MEWDNHDAFFRIKIQYLNWKIEIIERKIIIDY